MEPGGIKGWPLGSWSGLRKYHRKSHFTRRLSSIWSRMMAETSGEFIAGTWYENKPSTDSPCITRSFPIGFLWPLMRALNWDVVSNWKYHYAKLSPNAGSAWTWHTAMPFLGRAPRPSRHPDCLQSRTHGHFSQGRGCSWASADTGVTFPSDRVTWSGGYSFVSSLTLALCRWLRRDLPALLS